MIDAWGRSKVWEKQAVPVAVGIWAAGIMLMPSVTAKAAMAAPLVLLPFCWWLLIETRRWLLVFLCALFILPPLPIQVGDSGPHPALLILAFGILVTSLRCYKWKRGVSRLSFLLCGFMVILLLSVCTAAIESGTEIALGSFLRVVLFAIGPFTFFCTLNDPGFDRKGSRRFAKALFRAGVLAGLFACLDFYFQWPTPAGFGPQFVWLDEGVFRRAQGLFYEASTLGNFCAFFLIMILVAFRRPKWQIPISRWELGLGAVVFSIALIFSYSRGSLLNVLSAALALALLERKHLRRSVVALIGCAVVCPTIVYVSFPAFAGSYLSRLSQSLRFIWSTPNGVLSGRIDTWEQLRHFLFEHPWHVLLGIGYKTLPYSDLVGSALIADNTYLSLLIEVGVAGLVSFLLLNAEILKRALAASRSSEPQRSFFGEWIFCFWIGEMVQMASGDLITYWRVLPLYFWVLAMAVRPEGSPNLARTEVLRQIA